MEIGDLTIESIEKYLEKKKKENEFPKVFTGSAYTFKVNERGSINIYESGIITQHITDSLPALYDAVEESKRIRR